VGRHWGEPIISVREGVLAGSRYPLGWVGGVFLFLTVRWGDPLSVIRQEFPFFGRGCRECKSVAKGVAERASR